ncbi:hypothetical protein Bbelb_098600 [Branchiostoma belcheri]|nr:hypothetical protein Bbelb_098600 [Branchiostoma belcheri]
MSSAHLSFLLRHSCRALEPLRCYIWQLTAETSRVLNMGNFHKHKGSAVYGGKPLKSRLSFCRSSFSHPESEKQAEIKGTAGQDLLGDLFVLLTSSPGFSVSNFRNRRQKNKGFGSLSGSKGPPDTLALF